MRKILIIIGLLIVIYGVSYISSIIMSEPPNWWRLPTILILWFSSIALIVHTLLELIYED